MHVTSAFGVYHDSPFLPVKRASAHAISCLKTVWVYAGVISQKSPNSLLRGVLSYLFVCCGRASKPCPACVRHKSTVCLGRASKLCPPLCARLAPRPAPPRLVRLVFVRLVGSALAAPPSVVSPMLRFVFAMSPLFVLSLSLDCPLVVRSLSVLCRFLAGSMVWLWPGLCQLCVRSLVFAPLSVLCPTSMLFDNVCSQQVEFQ